MIMLDDLHVEETYASLVVQLLPILFEEGTRLLRLHGLPADRSVACSLLSSSCVELPGTLVLDFSSPDSINAFLSWLPGILTSTEIYLRAQPLKVHLCFKYDAALVTKDCMLWADFDNILADDALALITLKSLDAIDNVPDSTLEALLRVLLPKALEKQELRRRHSSTESTY
ncbi:hypothetical protein BDZ89DRAFT_1074726 [Hymenopellis radicata]|nr:hypothetical protein BDZ89DRAFT_1074726 [Hymenopellis radicata]